MPPMQTLKGDDWTIERWRTEPRLVGLTFGDETSPRRTAVWRGLTIGSVVALLLWGVATMLLA